MFYAKNHPIPSDAKSSKSMKILSSFVLVLSMLSFAPRAVGDMNDPAAESGSFVTLKQTDLVEFRAFVAGPASAEAAVLVVHDYFGISDAMKQSVERLGTLGFRSVAVDL